MKAIPKRGLESECSFRTSRSSGAGGQHVNKVSTRVELLFDVANSDLLNEEEKGIILKKLKNRISAEGILQIASQESRSQLKNKRLALEKFYELLEKALTPRKKRVPTKPTKAMKEKRLEKKKEAGEKKQTRKKLRPPR